MTDSGPEDADDAPGEETIFDPGLIDAVEHLLLGGRPTLTRVEVAERVGVPLELAAELWHALGFPHVADDDVSFTEADVVALGETVRLIEAGILDEESQAAMVRTWGRSFARLAEWQAALLTEHAADSGDPDATLTTLAADVLPLVDSLQTYIWRRHLLAASSRQLVRPEGAAVVQCVGFVDIVGYTATSRRLDQGELVGLIERFESTAAGLITDHGAHLVKTIGDEVLFVCDDPASAARIALDLTEGAEVDDDFPRVRAGLAHGDVVRRLGDVFGATVNIAARLTGHARPGTVLVDRGVADALAPLVEADPPEVRLRRVRRTSVKGYARLESWRLNRATVPESESPA